MFPAVQPDPPTLNVSIPPLLTVSVEVLLKHGRALVDVTASTPPLTIVLPV